MKKTIESATRHYISPLATGIALVLSVRTIAAMRAGKPLEGIEPWAWWDFAEVQVELRRSSELQFANSLIL